MSDGIIGKGTVLSYESTPANPEAEPPTEAVYTDLGEVVDCSDPSITVDEAEFTHYESPDGYKEIKPTWADPGEIDVELNYLPAQEATLLGLVATEKPYRITKPDGATWDFSGFIKGMSGKNDNKGKCSTTLKIRVMGKPTFAQGD